MIGRCLEGRVALITGGATGIGAAHVRAFAEAGARVGFLDVQDGSADTLASQLRAAGHAVHFVHCDLSDLAALGAAVGRIGSELGPVTALVNNAAMDDRHELSDIDAFAFERMMNINLRHVIFTCQAVAEQMKGQGGGAIVNTSSVAWVRGSAKLPLYSAAKAAIVGFTNSLARELGPYRIRVNALLPGFVLTERQLAGAMGSPEERQTALSRQCLPDAIETSDVAAAAVFLCSEASRMITKQCLMVNAGSL